jgi:hypothetical protein
MDRNIGLSEPQRKPLRRWRTPSTVGARPVVQRRAVLYAAVPAGWVRIRAGEPCGALIH